MQKTLEDFLRALRNNDIAVSPAEAIDAHLAVAAVGYADRGLLRDSLCVTLAKSEDEVARFDQCFENFFDRTSITPTEDVGDPGLPHGTPDFVLRVLRGDEASIAQSLESAAGRVRAGDIRLSTQRSLFVRRVMDEMGLRDLEEMVHALRSTGKLDDEALADRLSLKREELFRRASVYIDRQVRLHANDTGRRLRESLLGEQSITAISTQDLRAMEAVVSRMAKRLATRYARKRRHARRGRVDVRTTTRRSMGYGGIPFEIIWKTEVVHKPKIVVICDVSRSVAAAAQFLLLFLYALGETVEKLDAYAFSDRLVCVNDLLDEATVDNAITGVLARIGFRPTDYGQALVDFCGMHGSIVDRRTTVIILGDGRSNSSNPRLDLMREIADRARAIVWLNPEPQTLWNQGDSEMHAYRRFCTVAKCCNTLKSLEAIIDDVLRRYTPK